MNTPHMQRKHLPLYIYHGSKVSGIDTLEARAHWAVDGEEVVFATPDRIFAIAMIHGNGTTIALDYADGKVYIDEIEEGAFEDLRNPGYLYVVPSVTFKEDKRLIKGEYISHEDVEIILEEFIHDVYEELQSEGVVFVKYADVPNSLEMRKGDSETKENTGRRFEKKA